MDVFGPAVADFVNCRRCLVKFVAENRFVSNKPLAQLGVLTLVLLLERGTRFLVVTFDDGVGIFGNTTLDEFGRRAEEAVAAADVVVEKRERFAGFEGFEPKGDFAQLNGHGVDVHAIKAVADDIAQGCAVNGGAGFILAAAHAGEMPRNAVAGTNDEVAGAGGHIADC